MIQSTQCTTGGKQIKSQEVEIDMEIPNGARIFIVEGIAGAGKSTFHTQLEKKLGAKKVLHFFEDELLFSLKHAWIPGIAILRLEFFKCLLEYCEQKLQEDQEIVFIFERFHLSLAILAWAVNHELPQGYDELIHRLKKLPVHLFIPTLDPAEIGQRALHPERADKLWETHLQKRLHARNYASLQEMYTAEQQLVLQLAASQGIPYTTIQVAREQ